MQLSKTPQKSLQQIEVEEPMMQKDPTRYLRNGDIEGSSPKASHGLVPNKFYSQHKIPDDLVPQ